MLTFIHVQHLQICFLIFNLKHFLFTSKLNTRLLVDSDLDFFARRWPALVLFGLICSLFVLCAYHSFVCCLFLWQLRCHGESASGHASLNKDPRALGGKTTLKSNDSQEEKESRPLISGPQFGQCGRCELSDYRRQCWLLDMERVWNVLLDELWCQHGAEEAINASVPTSHRWSTS